MALPESGVEMPRAEARDPARLRAVVRQAWHATLGVPSDGAGTWQEAGADSLATLHLLLHLERALAQRLSFDLIDGDMTADAIADAIARWLEEAEAPMPTARPVDTMYLVPGVFGDEPILAAFRRAFAGCIRFEVVELPGLDGPARLHRSVVATAAQVAREIARRSAPLAPGTPLLVAGFSYGGAVAFEAARALVSMGRSVSLVAILDTLLERSAAAPSATASLSRRRAAVLGLARHDALRAQVLATVRRVYPGKLIDLRRELLLRFREAALLDWRPEPLPVPLLHVASDSASATTVAAWRRLSPTVRTVHVPGAHLEIFQPAALAAMRPAIEQAVRAAVATATEDPGNEAGLPDGWAPAAPGPGMHP